MESSLVVEVSTGMESQYLEALAQLFRLCFDPVRETSAFAESRDPVHFLQLVSHPTMRCFTAFASETRLVGFTAVTTNLSRISWIEPEFYAKRCPEAYAEGRFYYFPYIFVHPDEQTNGVVRALFDSVLDSLLPERAVVGFDVSDANEKLIHAFRSALVRASIPDQIARVDTHAFFVTPLEPQPVELLNRTPATVDPR